MENNNLLNGQERQESVNQIARLPKNIRQIGQADKMDRIYLEDYVMTFIRQLSRKDNDSIIILFGNNGPVQGINATFINGAVRILTDKSLDNECITCGAWDEIYQQAKEHFDNLDVVGWAYISSQMEVEDIYGFMINRLRNIHKTNFPGEDKVLLVYDSVMDEENFYKFTNGELKRQRGHFLYYERNDRMQEYMMQVNGSKSFEQGYDDEITKKIRDKAMQGKENFGVISARKDEGKSENYTRKAYMCAMIAAVVALAFVAAGKSNLSFDKVKDVVKTNSTREKSQSDNNSTKGSPVTIEDVEGKTPTPVETKNEAKDDATKDNNKKAKDDATKDNNKKGKDDATKDNGKQDSSGENASDTKNVLKADEKKNEKDNTDTKKKDQAKKTKAASAVGKYYTVKDGDTLAGISISYYGTMAKVNDICESNNISNEDMIHPGDKIVLP